MVAWLSRRWNLAANRREIALLMDEIHQIEEWQDRARLHLAEKRDALRRLQAKECAAADPAELVRRAGVA